ncbi:MAG TPA: hypothetical protein VKT49_24775 [Bryobacteraceae bacterium]|nr:hypothetical protein [Bryobacteraceae bacterium]
MTKIEALLFLLAAGSGTAQFMPGTGWMPGRTPAQMDWWEMLRSPDGWSRAPDLPSGETVSAARLLHKPPRKARNAFVRAIKLAAANDHVGAAAEFKKAINFDPEFSEAHGNLGVEYVRLGRDVESVPEFQRALQLDPATALHHANFSYALARLNRLAEAELEAQTAVSLAPSDPVAQFLLGCLLARNPQTRNFSERHLMVAAQTLPVAHLALALVYQDQGAAADAATEMKRYRQSAAHSKERSPQTAFLPGQ